MESSKVNNKVYVLCTWAPPMVGGPQNFYNIFCSVPAADYKIITRATSIEPSHKDAKNWLDGEYHFIENDDLTRDVILQNKPEDIQIERTMNLRQRLFSKIFHFFHNIPYVGVRFANLIVYIYITWRFVRKVRILLKRYHENVLLLGLSDNGPALMACFILHKLYKRPYALFLYDLYRGNDLGPTYTFISKIVEQMLIKHASSVIVTNDQTKEFLERRYNTYNKCMVVQNSVFPKYYENARKPYSIPTPPYKIVFTGHVYWAQEGAVLNLIQAMDFLADLPVTLDLYIPKNNANVIDSARTSKKITITSAPQSEMPAIQSAATLLFLPLAWNTKAPDIIATATPGKFTDYLAAGRPMLIHAPDYAYVSKYGREHNLGLVVDQDDPKALAEAIRRFLTNPVNGKVYVENALRIFHQNHDARKNAAKLTKLLEMV